MSIKSRLKKIILLLLHGEAKPVYANIVCNNPNERLKGRKIIITGGSRGLGEAMARKFKSEGASVLITGRIEASIAETAKSIGCKYLVLDLLKPQSFDEFINSADELLGGVDTLVNNAGISLHENTFFDVTPVSFDTQINTNFRGPLFLTQSFIRRIKANGKKGNVLFISSETGDTTDCRPYGYTKAAINSMVKGLANLFQKESIRINAVAPGITATEMTGINVEGNINAGSYATGRFYIPQEIAEVATFLISDESGCVSGQIITCNNAQTVNPRWK